MKVFDWRPESTFFGQPKTEWKLETMFKALEKLEKAREGRFSPLNYCSREMAEREIARLKGETA